MRPDREPGRPDGGELVDEVAEVLRPVRDGAERVVLRQGRERRRDLLVDLGGEQAERLGARLLGCEVRVVSFAASAAWRPAVTSPSRQARSGSQDGSSRNDSEGELPASARGRDDRGDRRERGLERRPVRRQRSLEPRGVREPRRGERAEHLELRVRPCLEPAIELEHVQLVEHDRAVRLLDADRANLGALRRDAGERGEASRRPPAARRRRPPRRRGRARRGSARASRGRSGPRRSRA